MHFKKKTTILDHQRRAVRYLKFRQNFRSIVLATNPTNQVT